MINAEYARAIQRSAKKEMLDNFLKIVEEEVKTAARLNLDRTWIKCSSEVYKDAISSLEDKGFYCGSFNRNGFTLYWDERK